MLANVGFTALLEGGQSDLYIYGSSLLARRSFLLHDVDAGCGAIAYSVT
jgi:hypothetical protein